MTRKEMNVLADIISTRVVDELLMVIKVRGSYGGWVENSTNDYDDLYDQYHDKLNEEMAEKLPKKKTGKIESEETLVGEMASLMTQMGMHLQKEEYEKCAKVKERIVEVKKILKDNYDVSFDMGDDRIFGFDEDIINDNDDDE